MGADSVLMRLLSRIPYGLIAFGIAAYFGYQYWFFNYSDESELLQKRASIEAVKSPMPSDKGRPSWSSISAGLQATRPASRSAPIRSEKPTET